MWHRHSCLCPAGSRAYLQRAAAQSTDNRQRGEAAGSQMAGRAKETRPAHCLITSNLGLRCRRGRRCLRLLRQLVCTSEAVRFPHQSEMRQQSRMLR